MEQYDGIELTKIAVASLIARKQELKLKDLAVVPLPEFIESAKQAKLSMADKQIIVDQAILLIDQLYSHLPFKRARYAVDPIRRLRLLRSEIGHDDDDQRFHNAMLQAFSELRDPHSFYVLPEPFARSAAFLPFFLQSYFEDGKRKFVVTNVLRDFHHPFFKPGVEVVEWNGKPVERAVNLLAEQISGGNEAAKFFRGMMRMTVRSLSSTPPPDEHFVYVGYRHSKDFDPNAYEVITIPWSVGRGLGIGFFSSPKAGICEPLADLAIVREVLWGRGIFKESADQTRKFRVLKEKEQIANLEEFSCFPRMFQFQHATGIDRPGKVSSADLRRGKKRFGYIQIRAFNVGGVDPAEALDEFLKILRDRVSPNAPDGLIIDVRANAGGDIELAESILQMLTPTRIRPAQFRLPNTPLMRQLLARLDSTDETNTLEAFVGEDQEALEDGTQLTHAQTLTNEQTHANTIGQVFQGPVVLLIDAGSYSATDIFAGGFQDHKIGTIIGVDPNTGGGGASVWRHKEHFVKNFGVSKSSPFVNLPMQVNFGVALLRSERVNENAGQFIEDVGVQADDLRPLTFDDLLGQSSDLVRYACSVLAKQPSYKLKVVEFQKTATGFRLKLKSSNLDRIVCFLNGNPQATVDGSAANVLIPLSGMKGIKITDLSVKGYATRKQPKGGKALDLVVSVVINL